MVYRHLPNVISFSRVPLAALFPLASTSSRLTLLAIALFTDGLDGWMARKFNYKSRLGALLDPATDKLFVLTALISLHLSQPLPVWQWAAFFARDLALLTYVLILLASGHLGRSKVKSIWPGKVTTVLQFITLALLTVGETPPAAVWYLFFTLGAAFFYELYRDNSSMRIIP